MRLKDYLSILAKPPLSILVVVSSLAWVAMLVQHQHGLGSTDHFNIPPIDECHFDFLLKTLPNTKSLAVRGWCWLVMLLAMMSPLLVEPINYLWLRSLSRKRAITIISFLIAYIAIWMLAGIGLMLVAFLLKLFSNNHWFTAFHLALILAVLWQVSPGKQICLNHCHLTPRLSPFGMAAIWDCCRYGFITGLWCIGSCWSLMLLPLSTPHKHIVLMAVGEVIIIRERYRANRPAQWHIPILGQNVRLRD